MDTANVSISEKTVADAPFNDPTADFILISSDGVLFYVHRIILACLSPVFKTMLTLPGKSEEVHDGRPWVTMGDEAKKLHLLLSWCDQRCTKRSLNLDSLQSVLELAQKYDMGQITAHVGNALMNLQDDVAAEPLRLFCMAAQFRLPLLAHAAAMETLKTRLLKWREIPEMHQVPTGIFIRLFHYRVACIDAVQATVKKLSTIDSVPGGFDTWFEHSVGGNWCTGTGWFDDYVKRVQLALEDRPTATTLDSAFLQESLMIIKNSTCDVCHLNAPSQLMVVHQYLIKEIEREIRQVEPYFF